MSIRESMAKRYDEIINNITNFLQRLSINQNSELEREYYLFIEQDAEKLLDLNNYAILNIELFEKIRNVFKMLATFLEDHQVNSNLSYFNHIINDLYFIFKYVYENILFMIENEFLIES
jgi:hypothetical protein